MNETYSPVKLANGLFLEESWKYPLYAITAFTLLVVLWKANTSQGPAFINHDGAKMKVLPSNTRFRRFTAGQALSEEGFTAAAGEPYVIRNCSKIEIVLSQPQHLREFYAQDGQNHAKPPHMNMGHYFDRVLGQSVGVQSGHKWRTTRANFDPFFSHNAALLFKSRFSHEVSKWLEDLRNDQNVVQKTNVDFSIDAVQACRELPFKLVACACYGDLLTDATFSELLELNNQHENLMATAFFSSRTTSKLYGILPFRETAAMNAYHKDWTSFNMRIVDAAQMTGLPCPASGIYRGVEQGQMTQAEYLQTIDEILFTNVDVTSAVLGFLLINLAANQTCQYDLRAECTEELLTAGVTSNDDGLDRYLAASGTLLEYTCMESVRLCPAAWFSLPEYSQTDKRIGGYHVPAGVPMIIDWKRLNTESPVWNPPNSSITGHTFEPRRFKQLSPSQYRYSLLRFGIGPRKCIGKNFAGIIMKLFLLTILPKYKIEFVSQDGKKDEGVKYREDRFTVTPQKSVSFVKLT